LQNILIDVSVEDEGEVNSVRSVSEHHYNEIMNTKRRTTLEAIKENPIEFFKRKLSITESPLAPRIK